MQGLKIKIEIDPALTENEVVIRCASVDDSVHKLHQFALQQASGVPKIVFYKGGQEFYFSPDRILFFETEGEAVHAHTEQDSFLIKHRLYELEELLPRHFLRVSKSCIANVAKIYSIQRDLTASSRISFAGTHKQIYASRRYYAALKNRIQERSSENA